MIGGYHAGCLYPTACVGFSVVRGNEMLHMPKLGVVVGVLGIQRWKGINRTGRGN